MNQITKDLQKNIYIILEWVKGHPNITKIYLYGSRIKGNCKADSDLDIALEFKPFGIDNNCDNVWTFNKEEWYYELQEKIPIKIHIEWFDRKGTTPRVENGIKEGCILIYDQENKYEFDLD